MTVRPPTPESKMPIASRSWFWGDITRSARTLPDRLCKGIGHARSSSCLWRLGDRSQQSDDAAQLFSTDAVDVPQASTQRSDAKLPFAVLGVGFERELHVGQIAAAPARIAVSGE